MSQNSGYITKVLFLFWFIVQILDERDTSWRGQGVGVGEELGVSVGVNVGV